jgi:uncharacterized membrane protein
MTTESRQLMANAVGRGSRRAPATARGPSKAPAFILGLGLGGLIDGVVLHQILQWHHMLTGDRGGEPMTTLSGLETNTLVDGFFHVITWVLIVTATTLTARAWQRGELAPPWRMHFGMLLLGWGVFNLVEGLIDHQLLGIHHVRDDLGAPVGWDLAFLGLGVLLSVIGLVMVKATERRMAEISSSRGHEPSNRS